MTAPQARGPRMLGGAVLLFTLFASSRVVQAQAVHSSGVERAVPSESFWRLTYENDFFTATDRFYTQGILLEVVHPRLQTRVLEHLLFFPRGARNGSRKRFGVAFEDNGYTSSDLKQATIPFGDRTYAGTKQLRAFVVVDDSARRGVTTSALTIGVIGPAAGGREIQTYLHRKTGNTIPMGWTHQIRNDVILNYEVATERQLHRISTVADLHGTGNVRVGTFHTAAVAGATVRLGRLPAAGMEQQSDAADRAPHRPRAAARRAFYAYAKPQLQLVGYDATLQGGMFNRSSPYTIASGDMSRAVYRQQLGVVYQSRTRFIELSHIYTGPSFRSGAAHRTGGITFGVLLPRRESPSR